eukprot:m.208237 g.208237  ORF g.208237 m.208237 type:complete len:359 (-) comp15038_c2_seq16:2133-3209(-)
MVQCIACEDWFHLERNDEQHAYIADYSDLPHVSFVCSSCNTKHGRVLQLYDALAVQPTVDELSGSPTNAAEPMQPTETRVKPGSPRVVVAGAADKKVNRETCTGAMSATSSVEAANAGATKELEPTTSARQNASARDTSATTTSPAADASDAVTTTKPACLAVAPAQQPQAQDVAATSDVDDTVDTDLVLALLESKLDTLCATFAETHSDQRTSKPGVEPSTVEQLASGVGAQQHTLRPAAFFYKLRSAQCSCDPCKRVRGECGVSFLADLHDTIEAYEERHKAPVEEEQKAAEKELLSQFGAMDRVQQSEMSHGLSFMQQSVRNALAQLPAGTVVTPQHIQDIFSGLLAKRPKTSAE